MGSKKIAKWAGSVKKDDGLTTEKDSKSRDTFNPGINKSDKKTPLINNE